LARVLLFDVQLLDDVRLLGGKTLRLLAGGARLVLELCGARLLEVAQRPLDLRARVEQVLPRLLPRFTLDAAFQLAYRPFTLRQVLDALLGVLQQLLQLGLALRELRLALLELLDERRQVAFRR